MKEFSLIVPVYMAEEYITECLESIVNQTYADFELILVDDGSPDNCPKIMDNYAKKDDRITVLHKENQGVVSARKSGAELASGKYILNIDADDYISNDTLMTLHEIIKIHDVDVVCFGYYRKEESGESAQISSMPGGYYSGSECSIIYESMIYDKERPFFNFGITPSLWTKLIRRELFLKRQAEVNKNIVIGEDFSSVYPILLQSDKIFILNKPLYHYRILNDSLSHRLDVKSPEYIRLILEDFTNIMNFNVYNMREQLGSYTAYQVQEFLGVYIRKTNNYSEFIKYVNSFDRIIFRFMYYCNYGFSYRSYRTVFKIFLIRHRFWKLLWILSKRKGGRNG